MTTGQQDHITFLHHEALQELYPEGHEIRVHLIRRVHDFFLGLNAGTWLKIRMQQISEEAQKCAENTKLHMDEETGQHALSDFLLNAGLAAADEVEAPPADAGALQFHACVSELAVLLHASRGAPSAPTTRRAALIDSTVALPSVPLRPCGGRRRNRSVGTAYRRGG